MKWITLLLAIVLPLFMTSCAVVPASNGYYSRYYEDRMNPNVYYYDGGFRSHFFHDYDRDRYYEHGHHSGYRHDYDRGQDRDHDYDHHYDHDHHNGYHH